MNDCRYYWCDGCYNVGFVCDLRGFWVNKVIVIILLLYFMDDVDVILYLIFVIYFDDILVDSFFVLDMEVGLFF